ncbi:flagellar filament capping protein FliD [Halomonas sp. ML-15]|uniref:flagellar filament capping protein FliD n=1 Tax=Halomonas sp. ML-15 TaxID=2773305 RepID=UPI0017474B3E|nr:flagellar filament capping protein FliD [Halomonas sp. ML-15]MBD3896154.1 flagellar filament capping protein FliD [Halomonas sp. ML-15]
MSSITSLGVGSGLDLNGLLGQMQEAEEARLEPIAQQVESQQVQISAYGEIQSALSGFGDSVTNLNDPSLYQSVTAEVSGDAVQAAAGPEASPGRFEVDVQSTATAGNLTSERVEYLDTIVSTEGGELALTFANDELDHSVDIAADSTLEDVRDAVNADPDAAVNASIVFDGEGHRLTFMSQGTGEQASITGTNFAELAEGNLADEPGGTIGQPGQDAELSVNGIDITSPTNQVEDAIQGVTLDLQEPGSSVITVAQDTGSIREAVTGFVDSFNELRDTTDRLTDFDSEEGEAGPLIGDSAVRTIESSLRNELSAGEMQDGELSLLSDMGLSLSVDGTLELDEQQLDSALANDPDAVAGFFAGDDATAGLAGRLESTTEQLLSSNGALEGSINSAENRIDSLGERFERTEQSIEQTIDRYRTQFQQLDSMMGQMQQTSNYLTEQLSGMGGGQGGGGGMGGMM